MLIFDSLNSGYLKVYFFYVFRMVKVIRGNVTIVAINKKNAQNVGIFQLFVKTLIGLQIFFKKILSKPLKIALS